MNDLDKAPAELFSNGDSGDLKVREDALKLSGLIGLSGSRRFACFS